MKEKAAATHQYSLNFLLVDNTLDSRVENMNLLLSIFLLAGRLGWGAMITTNGTRWVEGQLVPTF